MIPYSPRVAKFVSDIMQVAKDHGDLTSAETVGGLRLLASMIEARANGARIQVHVVTEDGPDPADAWKT